MKNYNDITVLLVDGGDRQTLPLARALLILFFYISQYKIYQNYLWI